MGYIQRGDSWLRTVLTLAGYTAAIATLFMAAYLITTWFFGSAMQWMPYFHRNYVYHRYNSVEAYLFSGSNYVELVKLHLFGWMIFSVAYVVIGVAATAAGWRFSPILRHG